MGTWGTGPFDNDAAADFLGELQTAPARTVARALRTIAKARDGKYLELDDASAGWAACELIALSFGRGDVTTLDDQVLDALERLAPKEEQRVLALAILPRIANRTSSELASLWHEGDDGSKFDALMADLGARLEAASTGPRVLPRSKAGDVIYVPVAAGASEAVVAQVVGAGEVAVFEGCVLDEGAALEAVKTRAVRRLPTAVNKLLRRGRLVANVPVRKELKGRKLYAGEVGAIEEYVLTTASFGGARTVTYEEAQACDLLRPYDVDDICAAALGSLLFERVRSPDAREAELYERHEAKWAERRRLTSPGPFGDATSVERLVQWVEDCGIENAVLRFQELAAGRQSYGRPNEAAERRPYAFAGLVALWRDRWSTSEWPPALASRLPPIPEEHLLARALQAARILVTQVLTRDAELRLIWDGAPDRGESLRRVLQDLQAALQ